MWGAAPETAPQAPAGVPSRARARAEALPRESTGDKLEERLLRQLLEPQDAEEGARPPPPPEAPRPLAFAAWHACEPQWSAAWVSPAWEALVRSGAGDCGPLLGGAGFLWRVRHDRAFSHVKVRRTADVHSEELWRHLPGEVCVQRGAAMMLPGLVRLPVEPDGWVTLQAEGVGGPTFLEPADAHAAAHPR